MPELYRLVFAYRNIGLEVRALIRWFKAARGERKLPANVLELAAGPANHAIGLAKRGVSATALDVSQTMSKFARRHARQQGVALKVVTADMIAFRTKQKYDLVINMLDSINQIHRSSDLIKHFRSVADCLADDGIYVLELAKHEKKGQRIAGSDWKVRQNNTEVRVHWRPLATRANGKNYKLSLEVTTKDLCGVSQFNDILHVRTWYPKDLERILYRVGGFKIVARYGDFREDLRPHDKGACSYVLVLQKSET